MIKQKLAIVTIGLVTLLSILVVGCITNLNKQNPGANMPQTTPESPLPPIADKTTQKLSDYFPLTTNSIWEYQGEGNEYASFTREVLYTKKNQSLRGFPGAFMVLEIKH
jgi:hypothetical protein